MSALIIRMPQEKRERLKQVAKSLNISVNKLIDEMATLVFVESDADRRFRLRAARGRGRALGPWKQRESFFRWAGRMGYDGNCSQPSCPVPGGPRPVNA